MSSPPSGNLRRMDTWEAYFAANRKKTVKSLASPPAKSRTALEIRVNADDTCASKPETESSPKTRAVSAAHPARSPKSVHRVVPLDLAAAQSGSSGPGLASPIKTTASPTADRRDRLQPHSARPREIYAGPPGPGQYAPEAKITVLSNIKSPQRSGIGGGFDAVNRSATGPFGRAHASGRHPGPGAYLSPDFKVPSRGNTPAASFGNTTRDTIARKQVDPFIKPAPAGELSPGPGRYEVEGFDRITALDQSLKSTLRRTLSSSGQLGAAVAPSSPVSGSASGFEFNATPVGSGDAIKFANSRAKSPAATRLDTSQDRFETGPFGRPQLKRMGSENPSPAVYQLSTTLKIGATSESVLGKSSFTVASSSGACLGGTGGRSDPRGRGELYDAAWMPVPVVSTDKAIGPGEYDGASTSALGKQVSSKKSSEAKPVFGTESRQSRYNYMQPDFTSPDKKFTVPSPATYNVRDVSVGKSVAANKFGTSGRSPVGITYK